MIRIMVHSHIPICPFLICTSSQEIVQELWLLYVSSTSLVNSEDMPGISQSSQLQQREPELPLKDEVDEEFENVLLMAAGSDEEMEGTDGARVRFDPGTLTKPTAER